MPSNACCPGSGWVWLDRTLATFISIQFPGGVEHWTYHWPPNGPLGPVFWVSNVMLAYQMFSDQPDQISCMVQSICFLQTFWVKLQDLFWPRVMHLKPIFSGMSDVLSSLREYSVRVRFWELSGCPAWVSSTGCVSRGSLGDFKGWHLHISFPFCKMGC